MPGSSSICWAIDNLMFIELVIIKGEIKYESKTKNAGWITI